MSYGYKYEAGLTLLEVMLSLVLGLLIISFLLEIYVASMRSQQLQNALMELVEKNRLIEKNIGHAIHSSGYVGCMQLSHANALTSTKINLTPESSITGDDHSFTVQYAQNDVIQIDAIKYPDVIMLSDEKIIEPGQELLIADCFHSELIVVDHVSHTKNQQNIYLSSPLQFIYTPQVEIASIQKNHYFVKQTGLLYEDGTPIYALFIKNSLGTGALIDGVHSMNVRYSLIQNGVLREVSSSEIADWTKVVGVALMFELVSQPLHKTSYFYFALKERVP